MLSSSLSAQFGARHRYSGHSYSSSSPSSIADQEHQFTSAADHHRKYSNYSSSASENFDLLMGQAIKKNELEKKILSLQQELLYQKNNFEKEKEEILFKQSLLIDQKNELTNLINSILDLLENKKLSQKNRFTKENSLNEKLLNEKSLNEKSLNEKALNEKSLNEKSLNDKSLCEKIHLDEKYSEIMTRGEDCIDKIETHERIGVFDNLIQNLTFHENNNIKNCGNYILDELNHLIKENRRKDKIMKKLMIETNTETIDSILIEINKMKKQNEVLNGFNELKQIIVGQSDIIRTVLALLEATNNSNIPLGESLKKSNIQLTKKIENIIQKSATNSQENIILNSDNVDNNPSAINNINSNNISSANQSNHSNSNINVNDSLPNQNMNNSYTSNCSSNLNNINNDNSNNNYSPTNHNNLNNNSNQANDNNVNNSIHQVSSSNSNGKIIQNCIETRSNEKIEVKNENLYEDKVNVATSSVTACRNIAVQNSQSESLSNDKELLSSEYNIDEESENEIVQPNTNPIIKKKKEKQFGILHKNRKPKEKKHDNLETIQEEEESLLEEYHSNKDQPSSYSYASSSKKETKFTSTSGDPKNISSKNKINHIKQNQSHQNKVKNSQNLEINDEISQKKNSIHKKSQKEKTVKQRSEKNEIDYSLDSLNSSNVSSSSPEVSSQNPKNKKNSRKSKSLEKINKENDDKFSYEEIFETKKLIRRKKHSHSNQNEPKSKTVEFENISTNKDLQKPKDKSEKSNSNSRTTKTVQIVENLSPEPNFNSKTNNNKNNDNQINSNMNETKMYHNTTNRGDVNDKSMIHNNDNDVDEMERPFNDIGLKFYKNQRSINDFTHHQSNNHIFNNCHNNDNGNYHFYQDNEYCNYDNYCDYDRIKRNEHQRIDNREFACNCMRKVRKMPRCMIASEVDPCGSSEEAIYDDFGTSAWMTKTRDLLSLERQLLTKSRILNETKNHEKILQTNFQFQLRMNPDTMF
ncbi:hypothetical protein TRFO_17180 [Tritrichomonas foetus]|uniref:Uncharacterized protein n=1 Tax=Tritrichomonas foetus TaxID=1144522 RepID=A0A1J4KND3_9EUKA|nr:hypothetical protein TRFO_17180 [Tritrichomonas foetus]|eukprot:OHT12825.1 hypothetical protein TRFO_17180 [Tritrichomonas foetus]